MGTGPGNDPVKTEFQRLREQIAPGTAGTEEQAMPLLLQFLQGTAVGVRYRAVSNGQRPVPVKEKDAA